jgi:opacity protein-like surface antigen
MKKILFIAITITLFNVFNAKAGALQFGFNAGIATPDSKMDQVYNKNTMQWSTGSLANLVSQGLSTGYHVGIKLTMPLNSNFSFVGNLGYNSFPQSEIQVLDPQTGKQLATLSTATKVIPIAAGLNLYPFKSFISPYVTGEIAYNYIYTSVESKIAGQSIPISTTPTDSRFGFGLGIGTDISLGLLDLNVEGKYNYMNLIGKTADENQKFYFTLLVGVTF